MHLVEAYVAQHGSPLTDDDRDTLAHAALMSQGGVDIGDRPWLIVYTSQGLVGEMAPGNGERYHRISPQVIADMMAAIHASLPTERSESTTAPRTHEAEQGALPQQ